MRRRADSPDSLADELGQGCFGQDLLVMLDEAGVFDLLMAKLCGCSNKGQKL